MAEVGRPTKYGEEILKKTREYLNGCGVVIDSETGKTISVNLPSIEGLSVFLHINRDTIYQWEKENKEFSDIVNELRAKQGEFLINNGLSGKFNPLITKVILTKHGYREGVDATTNDKDLPTPILNGIFSNNGDKENSES